MGTNKIISDVKYHSLHERLIEYLKHVIGSVLKKAFNVFDVVLSDINSHPITKNSLIKTILS
jgi:hypothetical protein